MHNYRAAPDGANMELVADSYVHVYPVVARCRDGSSTLFVCECETMAGGAALLQTIERLDLETCAGGSPAP
jgi:hypothetical protein